MNALAGERVQVERQGRHQGLALAGLHLGDLALVEHHPADELGVEVAQADGAPGRLPCGRERLRQKIVQDLAVPEPLPELAGLLPKLRARQLLELGLQPVDPFHQGREPLDLPVVPGAEDLPDEVADHWIRIAITEPTCNFRK